MNAETASTGTPEQLNDQNKIQNGIDSDKSGHPSLSKESLETNRINDPGTPVIAIQEIQF